MEKEVSSVTFLVHEYFVKVSQRTFRAETESDRIERNSGLKRDVDVEFTLSLNNRTGKYFFCKDLIEAFPELVNSVLYWRVTSTSRPEGLWARVLGRLAGEEVRVRRDFPTVDRLAPKVRRKRPVVFMDPREVVFHQLKPADCVIVHDVGPVTHPEFYAPKVETTYQMVFAKIRAIKPSLIFVTEFARREFIQLFGDDFPAMDVISPPLRTGLLDGPADPPAGVTAPFLLTIGAIGTRKNQARAVQAFAASGLAARGFGYVLCGGPEPGFGEVVAVADRTAGVVRPGYVTDANLRWLYLNAAGFVLPSLLEGFGLPAAEAIAFNLVPLVSARGALHEVTGDAAILVDPLNVGMIAEGMKTLIAVSSQEKSERLQSLKVSAGRFTAEAAMVTWKTVLDRMAD